MKVRYSVEAFALALVFYTTGLEPALAAGAILAAGTVLGDALAEMAGKTAGAVIGAVATGAALFFAIGYIGAGNGFIGTAAMTGILVGKHVYGGVEEASTGEILKQNYTALVVMAVVAVVREFLGSGAVFGYAVGSFAVNNAAYLNTAFGLIFGGLGIAAVNTVLKQEIAVDYLWVAIPAAFMTAAASGAGMDKLTKMLCAAFIAVVLLTSVRKKMVFSAPGKHFAGLPVEMISLGFLTMMLSVIA